MSWPGKCSASRSRLSFSTLRSTSETGSFQILLSVAPVAQTPVLLTAPPGETEIARPAGVLALYIDEEGAVRQVTADPDSALPPAYEQAARQAFMAARFAPGEVDGVAVKSRIHVEVVFDNTPLTAE